MDNIKIYQERNVKALITKFENALTSVHLYINSYLAYNLKMLAVAVDATYLCKVLQELLDSWCKRLPVLGEEGVDINWNGVIGRLCRARIEFVERRNGIQPVKANIIKALPTEQKKWADWQMDMLKKEQEDVSEMDSSLYRLNLNPMEQDNLWCFATNDYGFCNAIDDEQLGDMRSFLRSVSLPKHPDLENYLMYEIDRIQTLANNLNDILTRPNRIVNRKEACDGLFISFFERCMEKCAFKAGMLADDFYEWLEDNRDVMSREVLLEKKAEHWKEIQESGFLDNLISAQKLFSCMEHFYDKGGVRKAYTGRYIYMRQFRYPNWWEKVEKFLLFTVMNRLIDEELEEYEDAENCHTPVQEVPLPTRNELIARSIRLLMDERDEENKGALVKYNNQWIAIYRVLVDYYGFSDKYVEFVKQVKDLDLDGIRIPCTLDGVKKVAGILTKDFNDWVAHKESINSKKPAFLRQYEVAARLLKILEALGIEKVEKT